MLIFILVFESSTLLYEKKQKGFNLAGVYIVDSSFYYLLSPEEKAMCVTNFALNVDRSMCVRMYMDCVTKSRKEGNGRKKLR